MTNGSLRLLLGVSIIHAIARQHADHDMLMQIVKTADGNYQGADYFSLP